ncbi:CynX/NimT family MFS transporter [Amycolatopsis albispora]|uniref:Major facilitator superfamily (MFS) profile domain-containing protein n=1 Tax=Amycolatopsis albispora TaxID=1804986 RepID=A0A344L0P6_9PSEU|nr:MFS transporter [Amycolatopsis albispora]AXB41620.1 hypothetical protein A4R43_03025 [Amycolatopsis albispora]
MTSTPPITRFTALWTLGSLVLLALNLRAAITGVPPILGDLALSDTETSVLTTLPMLCLGVFSALAPALARRFGTETAIAGALLVLTLGVLLRVLPAKPALFTGTVLAGAGIATGNVLLPAVVKRVFPGRVGSLTGLSMMLMSVSGAAAAGLAVPLEQLAGWQLSLAAWAFPAVVAAVAWSLLAARARNRPPAGESTESAGSLLRSPLAWSVTVFMGLASLMFYTLISWLPQLMREHGFTPATAGMMNSVIVTIGIPLGFGVPVLAARLRDQRPLVLGMVTGLVLGLGGLLVAPQAGWLWVTIFGLTTGSAFPLALTLLNLRSPTAAVTARLSGMAQSGGYLIAATGPLAFGLLHSVTGGWQAPIWLLLLLAVPQLGCGLLAARPGFIRPETPKQPVHSGNHKE